MKIPFPLFCCIAAAVLVGCSADRAGVATSAKPNRCPVKTAAPVETTARWMTPAEQSAFRDPDPAAPAVAYWGNVRVECSAEHQATLVSGANRYHIADLSIIGKVWDLQKQANSQFKAFFENTSIIYDLEIGYAIGGTPDLLARLLREGNHSEETVALAQAWCRDGSLRWCARCGSSFEIVDARLTPETRQRLARSMLAPATLPSTNPSSQSSPRAQEP